MAKGKSKVEKLVEEFKAKESKRFNRGDLRDLFHLILTDKEYEAVSTKYNFAKKEKTTETFNYADAFGGFLDSVFKYGGVKNAEERAALVAGYEPKAKDIEFFIEAVEEAMWKYVDAGKVFVMWADKQFTLLLNKFERTGKYEGEITIKRRVKDNEKKLNKKPGTGGKPVPKKKK